MRISAKADYAVRAVLELAAAEEPPMTCDDIAAAQDIPGKFLEKILSELLRADLVTSQRGNEGGYALARPASEIQLAEVLRVVEGPLAMVRGTRPEALDYGGSAAGLREAWVALRASMRTVLEGVTIEDIVEQKLPGEVAELVAESEPWKSH